jgi:putative component of membrane protein insertase Oxa1/YidC/SpoIIIJ protein YidD
MPRHAGTCRSCRTLYLATLVRAVALFLIRAYQRYVSPYKGFGCAYRICTGRQSCSALGYRAICRHGFVRGLLMLNARLLRCRAAWERQTGVSRSLHSQRGACDLPCPVDCDLPSCDLPSCDLQSLHCSRVTELFNCCPSPCDFVTGGAPRSARAKPGTFTFHRSDHQPKNTARDALIYERPQASRSRMASLRPHRRASTPRETRRRGV